MLFLVPGLVLLATSRRRRVVRIRIESSGVSWQQGRRKRRVAWQDLQAFTTVHYQRSYYDKTRHGVYLLDASSVVLAWELTDTSPPEEGLEHRYFCDQIAAHTPLRLRDLTETIERLNREAQAARAAARSSKAKAPPASVPDIPGMPPEPANPYLTSSRSSRKLSLGCVGLLLLLLLAFLPYPLGWAGQAYEPHYYAALVGRVHAEPPLYQDSFATDDNQWCLQQPNDVNSSRYVYADSTYQLSGTDKNSFVDCWRDYPYSNFAVETSVAQIGSDPQYDGAGLELRVNAYTSGMLAFVVDEEGYWHLWGFDGNNWTSLDDSGYSPAIHQGSGATNRLLAIADGDQFLLFVNGKYMATETVGGALSTGLIGVFSNDSTLTARFTNFAVYPLPSLAPPLPWES